MEPNKLEKLFAEKLESREIKPSEGAWDRLDAMLTVAEKPKPKRKFGWLYFAASVVGLLLIGTVFFNQKDSIVVDPSKKIVIGNSVAPKELKAASSDLLNEELNHGETKDSALAQKAIAKNSQIPASNKESLITNNNQHQVPVVSISNQKTEQKSILSPTNVASVDELLVSVANPSKNERQSNQKPSIEVNANNLLSQVDGELELTFREKVINKVNKNYQTVKVALSNRNNQE